MYSTSDSRPIAFYIKAWCSVLFVLFAFVYLYRFQPLLLEFTQHVFSHGQTSYSPLWGTPIIIFLLLLVQVYMARLSQLPTRIYALSYLPSYLLLGLLTSTHFSLWESGHTGFNVYAFLALVVVSGLLIWVLRYLPGMECDSASKAGNLWPNVLIMLLSAWIAGSIANSDTLLQTQLRVAACVDQKEFGRVPHVGRNMPTTHVSMNAMRAYALAQEKDLGNRLFDYAQPFGSKGLMPLPADTSLLPDWPRAFYHMLGGKPSESLQSNPVRFFELLVERDTLNNTVLADYLLCAYLLDRRLDDFAKELSKHYALNDSLPVHYKEALTLYSHLRMNPVVTYTGEPTQTNYDGFVQCREQQASANEAKEACRNQYGNTYWCYYYYGTTGLK